MTADERWTVALVATEQVPAERQCAVPPWEYVRAEVHVERHAIAQTAPLGCGARRAAKAFPFAAATAAVVCVAGAELVVQKAGTERQR